MDYSIIKNYEKNIIDDLAALVAIPSVASEAEKDYPFGKQAAKGLEFILSRAEALGFSVRNIGNAAGYAEYAGGCEGGDYAGVLTHVDVVPAGDGWDTDPFTLTIKDGRLFGRGVADDKGAAVVSLWCMKALADAGVTGKRKLRCIFGCGEEVGMHDMDIFFSEEPLPVIGFTPDSGYPVCNREKGILQFSLTAPKNTSKIKSFEAGAAVNCVAETARAHVICTDSEAEKIAELVREKGCAAEVISADGGQIISAFGVSAHAMEPHLGKNAASALLCALRDVFCEDGSFASTAAALFSDTNGAALGIDCADEPSGELTFNLGNARDNGENIVFGLDVRYPVTVKSERIIKKLEETALKNGLTLAVTHDAAPIYLPENSSLIKTLSGCFERVTGKPGTVYSTGGGTYARALAGRGIAFGMEFPESPETRLHRANEGYQYDDLMLHAQICLAAMHEMMTMDV